MGGHDEKGLDVVSFQKTVPLVSMARLHLIVTIQARQGGLCDVNLPTEKEAEVWTKPPLRGRSWSGRHPGDALRGPGRALEGTLRFPGAYAQED